MLAETQDNSGAQAVAGLTPACFVRIGPLAMPRHGQLIKSVCSCVADWGQIMEID